MRKIRRISAIAVDILSSTCSYYYISIWDLLLFLDLNKNLLHGIQICSNDVRHRELSTLSNAIAS